MLEREGTCQLLAWRLSYNRAPINPIPALEVSGHVYTELRLAYSPRTCWVQRRSPEADEAEACAIPAPLLTF